MRSVRIPPTSTTCRCSWRWALPGPGARAERVVSGYVGAALAMDGWLFHPGTDTTLKAA